MDILILGSGCANCNTLEQRAKAIRGDVDRIVTWAKKGDLASRRLAIAKTGNPDLVREVFEKAAQGMWSDRNGGYTRIMKLGPRKGDAAEVVIIELVTEAVKKKAPKSSVTKVTKKAAPKAKKAEEAPQAVEETVGETVEETVEDAVEETTEVTE